MNAVVEKPRKIVTNGTTRRIPADEPVFLLRAQDQYAAAAVRHWAGLVEAGGGDPEIIGTARTHADKMDAWPVKKIPDLPRVENSFVTVPETTLPDGTVVPEFQVGRYLSTMNEDGKAMISSEAVPTVEINYFDAIQACEAAGYKLIRETQALALAWNIYNVGENWTGGAVGVGSLYQGLRNDTVDEAQPNDYEPEDADERRWFVLSNGERIYDAAGHLFTWVFDDVQGDERGVIAKPFTAESLSIATAPHKSREKGIGWLPSLPCDWSGRALIRGGYWGSGGGAGVFFLGYVWPDGDYGSVGFRRPK